MGAIGKLVLIGLFLVASTALFRALFMFKPLPPPTACIESHNHKRISIREDPNILQRFKGALNIPSLSYKVHDYDGPQMLRLIDYIEKSKLTSNCTITLVDLAIIVNKHIDY